MSTLPPSAVQLSDAIQKGWWEVSEGEELGREGGREGEKEGGEEEGVRWEGYEEQKWARRRSSS